ncbi:MAG: Fe-S cluster assembly protein SufD [Rhizobiales bacterium 65-9]|nr:Fe-S cluster assembly protein SufD [Hyphomicrobiales bacterium]OJY35350.1 MAG: Fe-S cluster assembly protein SufD [Rhizobiales bacterium 65-9]
MAALTVIRNPAEEAIIARFPAAKTSLPGGATVVALRERAFAALRDKGLPHRRVEQYKYTDLRALMRDAAPPAPEPVSTSAAQPLLADAACLRFVNGWFVQPPSSLPAGVTALRLRDALANNHPLIGEWFGKATKLAGDDAIVALNDAFVTDGVVIHVAKEANVEQSILLDLAIRSDAPASIYPRALIVVEDGAKVSFVEHQHGPAGVATQADSLIELIVGKSAAVELVRIDETGDKALSLSSLAVWLGESATLSTLNLNVEPAASRYQAFVTFAGRDAKASIRGATLVRGSQHADATLVVDHVEPGGESRELFRTVLDGEATGVFQGKIVVKQKAQKTDGRMASNALMLSDGAAMNNKPELEIFADDVQCAHGATCGALDDNLLFYLMARGISRREAENLMIESFVGETIEPIENEALKEALTARVDAWLSERAKG